MEMKIKPCSRCRSDYWVTYERTSNLKDPIKTARVWCQKCSAESRGRSTLFREAFDRAVRGWNEANND